MQKCSSKGRWFPSSQTLGHSVDTTSWTEFKGKDYIVTVHHPMLASLHKNKATGWLGALVRVTNLKLSFLRVREKMLVFAGVVKKCVQHGHSFRLAGVWLKGENLNFACAVTRFFSSRVKKTLEFYDFKSSKSHQSRRYSILFFFHCSRLAVPECLWQCWCYSL